MAVIEELPDSYDGPSPVRAPAPAGSDVPPSLEAMIEQASTAHFAKNPLPSNAAGAEMPDAMAEVKTTTVEEFIRQMNKMPLFMTELDETSADDRTENVALEAIKALQEEGEPWEVCFAIHSRRAGNSPPRPE
jgi:hypothetical protein